MPRKIMDISLVEENKSDYTFFKIDEDENEDNKTLKALKQTYVTSNYKNETILNLQKELKTNSSEISKEIKLDSYNKYNNALDLATRHYITKAVEFIEEAFKLNPKDPDILNLKGLLYLLKCDFSKAFESFYTSQCYGNNELSRKYVNLLSSKDFKVFLERYNHSIRFINEELNEESIEIFDSLKLEEPELIEPYVISILLYDRVGDNAKKKALLEELRCIDKDNPIFEKFNEDGENIENSVNKNVEVKTEENTTKEEISKTNKKSNKKDKRRTTTRNVRRGKMDVSIHKKIQICRSILSNLRSNIHTNGTWGKCPFKILNRCSNRSGQKQHSNNSSGNHINGNWGDYHKLHQL